MEPITAVIVGVLVLGSSWLWMRRTRAKWRAVLAPIAELLCGRFTSTDAFGTFEDVPIRVGLRDRDPDGGEPWTELAAKLPEGYPFVLQIGPRRPHDAKLLRDGEMADVCIGEPAFDDRFHVEGAPAEVVRRVLTNPVREFLRTTNVVEVETNSGWLVLSVPDWSTSIHEVRLAVGCLAAIVTAVRAASLALAEATPMAQAMEVYRGIPDDAPVREARAARDAEVRRLERVRRWRRWRFWESRD